EDGAFVRRVDVGDLDLVEGVAPRAVRAKREAVRAREGGDVGGGYVVLHVHGDLARHLVAGHRVVECRRALGYLRMRHGGHEEDGRERGGGEREKSAHGVPSSTDDQGRKIFTRSYATPTTSAPSACSPFWSRFPFLGDSGKRRGMRLNRRTLGILSL